MSTKVTATHGTLKENLDNNPDWLDLSYGDAENGGVITVICISHLLYDEWETAQSEYFDDKQEFDIDNVTKPGVYRDDEIYKGGVEHCYTIVVDYDFMCREMIEEELEKLNEKYGTDFELGDEEKTVEL